MTNVTITRYFVAPTAKEVWLEKSNGSTCFLCAFEDIIDGASIASAMNATLGHAQTPENWRLRAAIESLDEYNLLDQMLTDSDMRSTDVRAAFAELLTLRGEHASE